jgi:subtilisin-like proprotein convertase family protein
MTVRFTTLFFSIFIIASSLWGQSEKKINYTINEVTRAQVAAMGEIQITAANARYFQLDVSALRSGMIGVAHREIENSGFIAQFQLPHPDGTLQTYRARENSTMHPQLAALFPEIKTYDAAGTENGATVKWDITPHGLHAMIMIPGQSTIFIDPAVKGNTDYYIVYSRKDFTTDKVFECDFNSDIKSLKGGKGGSPKMFGTCQLRSYRIAIAATGEYTTFHGGTVALALAAQNTTMNRVNGVYERDMAITMTIVPNNNLIIYTNAATDPYTNGTPGTMITQNQTNCDAVIGSANYDIGHVFGTNSGGLAGLGVVCTGGQKARGVTGSAAPIGDPFDIDYVAHEVGHQFGANHTQNNNCNRNNATAVEPGSASTIMGYAGICAPNVQNVSDDHFSGKSLEEISIEILSTGHTCEQISTLANAAPVITATSGNINIPISTPFALTATVTDADGDPVSFNWEQMDNEASTQPPVATSTGGPNFRSLPSSTSPTRYFPSLASLATNGPYTWEVLPSVARAMDFRVTVRDNSPAAGGCNDYADVVVTTVATAGPFVVNYPTATGITWTGATSQTVTWSVNNTDVAPVACGFVDILLSTDGGLTYPIVLATNVPNDGSQPITVPNLPSTTCRVMVICSNGTFFDISNNNFTITAATFDYTLTASPTTVSVCQPSNALFNINVGSIGGYNSPVNLSVSGVPAGATSAFSVNPVTPVGTSVLTISNTVSAAPGSYILTITGNSASGTKVTTVTLNISSSAPTAVTLTSPANGATGISTPTTFTWGAASGTGITYEIQISSDAGFASITDQATGLTGTTFTSSLLATSSTYYWRVRAVSGCGTGPWSSTFNFTTSTCSTTASTNVPLVISATGTPTITSTITIPTGGSITDVNILNLVGTHTYMSDLNVTLTSPSGTSVTLFNGICTTTDNFNLNFDNTGAAYTSIPCPPVGGGTYQPLGNLSSFNGQDAAGTWTLTIQDVADQDGGSLTSWSLQICVNPPVPCNNPDVPTVAGTNTICSGASTTLSISSGNLNDATAWTWYTGSCGGTIAGTGTTLTVSPTVTTTYYVRGTGGCATGGTCAQYTVTVNPLPTVNAGTDQTICAGQSVTLSGSGASTYSWNNGVTNGVAFTPASTATYTVTGTSAAGCVNTDQVVVTVNTVPPTVTLLTPANGATGVSIPTTFTWNASAAPGATYSIEVATDAGFTNIVAQSTGLTSATFTTSLLNPNTTYYWHVQVLGTCGASGFGATFSFTTTGCMTYSATGLPLTISATGTPTITSTINVPINGTITDVNVIDLVGTHTRMGDLTFTLTSPTGTTITLMSGQCGNQDNFNLDFDQAAAPGAIPCPPTTGLAYQPAQSLNTFNGQVSNGNWILTVTDGVNNQGGSLTGWSLQVCVAAATCTNPTTPTLSVSPSVICQGQSATLNITGTLNSATSWSIYTGSCGGTLVGTTATSTFTIPSASNTTYFVRGEDGTGCVNETAITCASISVATTPVPAAPLATVTNNCGNSVLSTAGTSPVWSTGATTSSITVTTAGSYTVTQTVGGCTSAPSTVTAAPIAVPAAPVATVTNNCGNSVLSTTGSNPVWSTGATTPSITVTTAGNYTVTQTVSGCTSLPTTITAAPTAIPAAPTATVTNNCGNSVLSATGTNPVWSTGATTASITVTTAGNYTVTQTVGGCTSSPSTIAAAPLAVPIIASGTVTSPTSCGTATGTVQITGSGTGNISWTGSATGSATGVTLPHTVAGLAAGTYNFVFNDGCSSAPVSVSVSDPSSPAAPTVSATNNCGNSVLSAIGTNLLWSTGATTASITVTTAGSYTVTQTVGGCTSAPATVTAAPIAVPAAPVATVTNNCGNSVLSTTGSNPVWSTGATTPSITVTSAGNYTVTQTVSGCTSLPTTVTAAPTAIPSAPTATVTNNCGNSVLSTTGTNPVWSTGATTASITVTTAGNYTVTQTVGGCTSSPSTIAAAPLAVPIIASGTVTNPTSCGTATGSVQITGSGTGNISWTGTSSGSATGVTLPYTVNGLVAGTYNFVFDNGCVSAPVSETISDPSAPSAPSVSAVDNCGSSILTANGTNLVWSTGATTSSITVTTAGSYTVTQTVGGCTSAPATVTAAPVANPAAPVASASDNCGNSVLTTTGTNPVWSTGETTASITVSTAGTFTVTQTVGGCTSSPTTVVANPQPAPTINVSAVQDPSTCGGIDGTITIDGTAGTVNISWSGSTTGSQNSVSLPYTITGLSAGTYAVVANNGCVSNTVSATVSGATIPAAPVLAVENFCGYSVLTANGSGIEWSTGETTNSITVTTSGIFYATQTSGGCTSPATSIQSAPYSRPVVTLEPFNDVCINDPAFALSGGLPAGGIYTGTGISANTFDPGVAGYGTFVINYTYTDGNSCSSSAVQNITVGCASLEEELISSVNVYPNPSSGIFNVEVVNDQLIEIIVHDAAGRLVYSLGNPSQNSVLVDLDTAAVGVYSLHIRTLASTSVVRVIVTE